jgi:tetratricopeptide (TPR) repeat protein
MKRDQLRFLMSGILLGFLVGYIVAHAVHEPRVKQVASPIPAAGNQGMGSLINGGAAGGGQVGPADGNDQTQQMMARIHAEIKALSEALDQDPNDATALIRLANLYHDSGKWEQAVEYYGRLLAIRPSDVNARTDMAICMRRMDQTDQAMAQFRTSLTYDPNHWQTWLNLGIVSLFDQNDTDTAAEAFTKLEELNPEFEALPRLKEALRTARAKSASD